MQNKKERFEQMVELDRYRLYTAKKVRILLLLIGLTVIFGVVAVSAGAADLSIIEVAKSVFGFGEGISSVVIWRIRMPRVVTAIVAGAGLSVAGCVMQNNLKNPLAAPHTLGISNAAAFGANLAIIVFGAGSIQSTSADAVSIQNPYLVTMTAFICAMSAAVIIIALARLRGFTPNAIVLAGVALNSLFLAGTTVIQYFAQDVQIAAAVFWTFGDLGRTSWSENLILSVIVIAGMILFYFRRWDYNALDSGEECAKSLGVHTDRIRIEGMLVSSLITAVCVSLMGIIGFIGLIAPHIMRRVLGSDHRYLIPASALSGSLLLLVSDTIARVILSPVVLPVGAVTSLFGAPLFLYILLRGGMKK